MTINQPGGRRWKFLTALFTAAILAAGLTACRTTHQVSISKDDFSGFLGDNYSLLQKGKGFQADWIYIDKNANYSNYTKVYIKSIELWKSDEPDSPFSKMSPEDQQKLVNYFNTVLVNAWQKNMQIVDQPGPNTLVVRVAITEARKSRPVMNLVSSVVPMAMVMSAGKQLITGSGTGVGGMTVEAEVTDGDSGQLLACGVDQRVGTKALRTKFNGTWGDMRLCMEWWAKRWLMSFEMLKKGVYGL
jgi:Protein of unknown function (DUF3313)